MNTIFGKYLYLSDDWYLGDIQILSMELVQGDCKLDKWTSAGLQIWELGAIKIRLLPTVS